MKGGHAMNIVDIEKRIVGFDTKEVTGILEALDENSRVLAKAYLSALMDRQQLEKASDEQ